MKKFKNLPAQSRPRIISDEIFNKILEDFKNNVPYYELKNRYGHGRLVIQNNFRFRKIDFQKRRYKKESQQVSENVFKDLSNIETQYWLGWLASDGAISGTRIALGVKELDKEILYKFREFLNSNINIFEVEKKMNNKTYLGVRMAFRNIAIVEYLGKLGIGERKSKTIKINFPITWDFMRGVIDGDGYIDSKRNRVQLASASKDFIYQVSEFFNIEEIKHSVYLHKPSGTYNLQVHALPSVFKLINLLYTNAHTYLQRKYDNAAQIRNNLEEKYSKFREPALGILSETHINIENN